MTSINDFLSHRQSESSYGNMLSKWRDKGHVHVFLHTSAPIVPLWRHQIPKLNTRKKDGKQITEIWTDNLVCHESESVLKRMRFRDDKNVRAYPPCNCGICKMTEFVYQQILAGKINPVSTLFSYEADDKILNITAGGACGIFSDFQDEYKSAMAKASINPKEIWKESMVVRLNYLFRVVDADAPSEGVKLAFESSLLGDKVKVAISDSMDSLGEEKGNPFKTPYCIKWEYVASAAPNKKYLARRLDRIPLTDEIRDLITSDPPDISSYTKKFKQAEVGASLEAACAIKGIPWGKLFGQESATSISVQVPAAVETADHAEDTEEDAEEVACDKCGKPILLTDARCKWCGHVYEVVEAAPPPPPPPPPPALKKRSERKAAAAATPASSAAPTKSSKPQDRHPDDEFNDPMGVNDDVPFLAYC